MNGPRNTFKKALALALAVALSAGATSGRSWGKEIDPKATVEVAVGGAPSESVNVHGGSAELIVSVIPASQEDALIRDLLTHSQSTVTVIDSGGNSEGVQSIIANLQRTQSATPGVEFIHIDTQQLKQDVEHSQTDGHSHVGTKLDLSKKTLRSGILISAWSAGMFAAPFYITANSDLAAKIFAAGFLIAGFQTILTPYWHGLLHRGGQTAVKVANFTAKIFGSTLKNNKVPEKIGTWAAAFGFNLGVAASVLGLQGALNDASYVLFMATVGTWDVIWDLSIDSLIKVGVLKPKALNTFVKYRVAISPAIEGMAYTAGPFAVGAAVTMGVVGTTGLVTFAASDQIRKIVDRRKCEKLLTAQAAPKEIKRAYIPDDIQ